MANIQRNKRKIISHFQFEQLCNSTCVSAM